MKRKVCKVLKALKTTTKTKMMIAFTTLLPCKSIGKFRTRKTLDFRIKSKFKMIKINYRNLKKSGVLRGMLIKTSLNPLIRSISNPKKF